MTETETGPFFTLLPGMFLNVLPWQKPRFLKKLFNLQLIKDSKYYPILPLLTTLS